VPLTRISATIPDDLVREADRKAAELDRSRSWVLAEALRRYLAPPVVREPSAIYDVAAEIQAASDRRLVTELGLTPTERVRRAEALGRLASRAHPKRTQVIGFEDYADFYEWKQARRIGA